MDRRRRQCRPCLPASCCKVVVLTVAPSLHLAPPDTHTHTQTEPDQAMFGAGTTGRTTLSGLDKTPEELEPLIAKINQVGGWVGVVWAAASAPCA